MIERLTRDGVRWLPVHVLEDKDLVDVSKRFTEGLSSASRTSKYLLFVCTGAWITLVPVICVISSVISDGL